MTQARAEDLVRDLVRAGEVQAEQAQTVIDELVDRSRRNSERLIDAVRTEIRQQMASLGLATKSDVERLERRIADASPARASRKATSRTAPARKATKTTKAAAKSGGRKAGARKASAKEAGAKKATKATKSAKASRTTKATRTRSTR
jgi:polyhydroxyalkanoate synthesis regulator phasin